MAYVDSQSLTPVALYDSNQIGVTSQANGSQRALDVGICVAGIQVDPRQIRALTATDVVTVLQGAGSNPWVVKDLAVGTSAPGTASTYAMLVAGEYNSVLPTLTTGQQSALQSNSSGVLLVAQSTSPWLTKDSSDGSATGGAAGTTSMLAGGVYNSTLPTLSSGQQTGLAVNSNGILLTAQTADLLPATQTITAQDTGSTTTAVYNQSYVTGTPTTGSTASFAITTEQAASIQITGTWTGNLVFETSEDGGTTWITHIAHIEGTSFFVNSVTGNSVVAINLPGKTNFRVRSTASWTGTATIKAVITVNQVIDFIANALKLIDGSSPTSSTLMNIVPASTAVAASNTAISVGLSPNSPLPTGTNLVGGTTVYVGSTVASPTNPLPVVISSVLPGNNVIYTNATASIAASGGTDSTSVYTITSGKTLSIKKVWVASSVHMRADFATSPDGSTYTTRFSGFTPFGGGNMSFDTDLFSITDAGTGSTIKITMTNEDSKPASAYITVLGIEN